LVPFYRGKEVFLEFFKAAKDQYLNFNFKESLENILQSFKFESLSKTAHKELTEIISILFEENKNRVDYFPQFFNLAESYFEKQNHPDALRIFDGLLPFCSEEELERNIFYIFFSAAHIGQLDKSLEAAKKLLYLRYKMKYLERGLELVNQVAGFNLSAELVYEYTIKFALLKKDIKTFNKSFLKLGLDPESDKFWEYSLEVEEKTKSEFRDWAVSKSYLKLALAFKITKLIKENISDPEQRKIYINLIYQYKIRYPKELFPYPFLLEYAIFYKRENLEKAIASYFARNPKKFNKNPIIKEKILNLLNGPRREIISETKPREMEETISEIHLLHPVASDTPKEFFTLSEKAMIKAVDLLSYEVMKSYYKDLIACFATMEFYKVALFILEKVENLFGSNINIFESLNLDYLRIDFFIKLGRFHEAQAMADDVVFYRPLFLKEKVGFLYLKAEALMGLSKIDQALELYKLIEKTFPNFRLVKGRLKEIENLK
jgi:tetratricopeptide (TPR) repeat protein